MKPSQKIVSAILILSLAALTGCSNQALKRHSGNYQYTTECLGTELDGSHTLKVWGSGRNRADAIEQARKNAIYVVLFKGITDGQPGCETRPVVTEVNANTRYETYFNTFFADGGDYQNFVSVKDEPVRRQLARDSYTGIDVEWYGLVVRVLRQDLKQKMISDGILTNR